MGPLPAISFTSLPRLITKLSLPAPLKNLMQRVDEFTQRYFKEIMVYGLAALFTFGAGFASPAMGRAVATMGGFFWAVGNTPGKAMAKDFLEEIPTENLMEPAGSRKETLETILRCLETKPGKTAPTAGWCLIHGEVGVGKTELGRYIANQYQAGSVYMLKPGASNYSIINEALKKEEGTPLLVIDEAWAVLQQGGWSELKNSMADAPCFNVLAITHSINGADPGLLSRFGGKNTGRRFFLESLPIKEVISLIKLKTNYSNVEKVAYWLNEKENSPSDLLRQTWQKILELEADNAPNPWVALRITEDEWKNSDSSLPSAN